MYDYLATWADKHHDAIEALSAIGGFVLTAVLVLSTVGLWIVTKPAANAAKAGANAAETAAKAAQAANQLSLEIFRAERRPIISVELDAHKDILWNGGSVETTVKVTLQNHGNSPADVFNIDIRAIPGGIRRNPPRNLNNELIDIMESRLNSPDLVPTNLSRATVYLDAPWYYFQVIRFDGKEIANAPFIVINIVGCIWYESFRGGRIYQAAFSWHITHVRNDNQITDRFQPGENVSTSALRFYRHGFDNFDREMPNEVRRRRD